MGEYITVKCRGCGKELGEEWNEEIEKPLTVVITIEEGICSCMDDITGQASEAAMEAGYDSGYEDAKYDEQMKQEALRDEA